MKGSRGIRQRETRALGEFFSKMQSAEDTYKLILVIRENNQGRKNRWGQDPEHKKVVLREIQLSEVIRE